MQISILDRQGNLPAEVHELAERRLLFALARFDSKINRVTMVLKDVDGPRGEVDKSCQVTVSLRHLAEVRVSHAEANLKSSIARTADRVGRAVARAIEGSQRASRRRTSTA
jgi:hypothetical protein